MGEGNLTVPSYTFDFAQHRQHSQHRFLCIKPHQRLAVCMALSILLLLTSATTLANTDTHTCTRKCIV